jgi:hypothetical protein
VEGEIQFVAAVAAFIAFGAGVAYWKPAVFAAMLLLVFDGALRKWVLPEAQAALYLAKDVVLLGAYVGFAARRMPRVRVPHSGVILAVIALMAVYGSAEVFNPALPTPALGLVGWRAYFFYVPLIFVVPHLFDSLEELQRALRIFCYLAIPVAVLGLVQFYSPAESAINMNVQHEEGGGAAIGFGSVNRVRVAGSFSFVSGFAAYLLGIGMLEGALLAASRWRMRGNAGLYAALALTIAAMFATGSRGPVYSLVAAGLAYAGLSVATGEVSVSSAVKAAFAALVVGLAMAYLMPEPAEAFRSRAAGEEDVVGRILSPAIEPFILLEEAPVLGFGIGAAHQSGTFITGSAFRWWTGGLVAESETSRVTLELGLPGLVLVVMLRIGVALLALRGAFALRSRLSRVLALGIALFLSIQVTGSVIFNPTMNLLYWFAVGLLFALHRLDAPARAPAMLDRMAAPLAAAAARGRFRTR